MSNQSSQGIQTLLEAEKDAASVVQEARQYRTQRLKDARSQASKEVEEYKKQKEEEFKSLESKNAGSTENLQAQVDKETEQKISELKKVYEAHKDAVLDKILDRVTKVNPELHRNLRKLES
ncbi:hypothetical protein Clacol_005315 [Clathrus columnatus]|uniref:V-type proton ATPase subunit G n=1 Tax=Clathrus columnatus TaxID=1419009 RepID=A0AAV5A8Z1_9AGAM|nr:hypothetical protein Clacol_005315 [Clathrus columnatus]